MGDRVRYLRSAGAVREQSGRVLQLARADKTRHFVLNEFALPKLADLVAEVTHASYPTLEVPFHARWRHFSVGGVDREAELDSLLSPDDDDERARAKLDLATVSVLLDAGAGGGWSYREGARSYARSEGLAVASVRMFLSGAFSSDRRALRVDADGLSRITTADIARGFQVSDENPLVGLEGRALLLRSLGAALKSRTDLFGDQGRPGFLFDAMRRMATGWKLPAETLLQAVLDGFSSIWPGRISLEGENLGDVWPYAPLEREGFEPLVPFHKLSQWLTYSLIEPIEKGGVSVVDVGAMTGLPEYRNGGLFLDGGVLVPKERSAFDKVYTPDMEFIVEWRALTVALLDAIAPLVCSRLDRSEEDFPLAKVLEGGTWATGRKLAREKRADGSPPLHIQSDGTVF